MNAPNGLSISFIHNMRFPTEKAHGYQIAKMCEAFADNGCNVELVVPRRKKVTNLNAFDYYNLQNNFRIRELSIIDALSWPGPRPIAFAINSIAFFLRCLLLKIPKTTIVFTRTPELAWLFSKRGYRTAFECHQLPVRWLGLYSRLLNKTKLIVAITNGLKDELIEKFKIPLNIIMVAPDGVDLSVFDINIDKPDARAKLGLRSERPIAVYTGQLIKWKGVDTLAEAAKLLGHAVDVYFIGGTAESVAEFRSRYPDAPFNNVSNLPRNEVALWLKAADVLVLPNTAKDAISARHTSPLKLFEYMASGTPIVASDLPSIKEIVDEKTVSFSTPDSPAELARAIQKNFDDPWTAKTHADSAKGLVLNYTWSARARNILNSMVSF